MSSSCSLIKITKVLDFVRIIANGEAYSKYKINEAINGSLREAKRSVSNNDKGNSKRLKVVQAMNHGSNSPSSTNMNEH